MFYFKALKSDIANFFGERNFLTDLSNQVFWKKVLFMSAKWHRPSLRGHEAHKYIWTNLPIWMRWQFRQFPGPSLLSPRLQCFHKSQQLRTWFACGPNCWNGLHLRPHFTQGPIFQNGKKRVTGDHIIWSYIGRTPHTHLVKTTVYMIVSTVQCAELRPHPSHIHLQSCRQWFEYKWNPRSI